MAQNNIRTAVKALIYSRGKYLLLLRSERDDVSPVEWDIPGGRVKGGEDPIRALIREMQEEVGLTVAAADVFPIKTWALQKGDLQLKGTDFLCVLAKPPEEIKLSPEHTSFRWFTKDEIMGDEKIPSWLKETVKLAGKP